MLYKKLGDPDHSGMADAPARRTVWVQSIFLGDGSGDKSHFARTRHGSGEMERPFGVLAFDDRGKRLPRCDRDSRFQMPWSHPP